MPSQTMKFPGVTVADMGNRGHSGNPEVDRGTTILPLSAGLVKNNPVKWWPRGLYIDGERPTLRGADLEPAISLIFVEVVVQVSGFVRNGAGWNLGSWQDGKRVRNQPSLKEKRCPCLQQEQR